MLATTTTIENSLSNGLNQPVAMTDSQNHLINLLNQIGIQYQLYPVKRSALRPLFNIVSDALASTEVSS